MDYDFEPRPNPLVRKIAIVVTIAFLATVVSAFAKSLFDGASDDKDGASGDKWVPVGAAVDIRRDGVAYHAATRTFIVADGERFLALSAVNPHLGHLIHFCKTSRWFEDPAHGEKFDRLGYYTLGPAPRGMDRVAVKVDAGNVVIDPTRITHGRPRGESSGQAPVGAFCVDSGDFLPPLETP